MKVIMIQPNIGILDVKNGKPVPFNDRGSMEPLQLGVLAGLTPDDIEVVLYDDRLEPVDYDAKADLVAISVQIFTARRAYEIADEFRKRSIPVVLGGIHVTTLPDEALQHADCIVTGDAETVWNELINDLKANRLKVRYTAFPGPPHPGKLIRRTIYGDKRYTPVSLLQFGRGCPYRCSFCASGNYFKGNIHTRSIDEVMAEIKNQPRRFIFFVDENIVGAPEESKQLFKALIHLKIQWIGQASIDMTHDPELMDLMQKSGCIGLVIGFESFTPEGLEAYNKRQNEADTYEQQIKIIRKHKIHIWAAFLLGHERETEETLQRTLDFAKKNKFSFSAFNILMPYPDTPIYSLLKNENRLLYEGKWWLSDEYHFNHAAYIPKNMSPEILTQWCLKMRKEYNSVPMILRRLLSRHNLLNVKSFGLLWQMVWLFRTEAFKKQGMKLGLNHRTSIKTELK